VSNFVSEIKRFNFSISPDYKREQHFFHRQRIL
jgi:hypothetical protein